MLEIKITVDLLGLPEALNNLAKALTKTERPYVAPTITPPQITPTIMPIPKDGPSDTLTVPPQVTNTTATANTPTYTLDKISKAGVELIDTGKMQELQKLLADFNVQAISQLKEDAYGAFAEGLIGLGAKI